jgi:hypothetical protein
LFKIFVFSAALFDHIPLQVKGISIFINTVHRDKRGKKEGLKNLPVKAAFTTLPSAVPIPPFVPISCNPTPIATYDIMRQSIYNST